MQTLAGRAAIITGASGGIGLKTAQALAQEGMHLVLAARGEEQLALAAASLSLGENRAITVPTDVTDPNALEYLVERTMDEFGAVDVLVNNAGVETYREFQHLAVEDIIRTIEVNLTATIILSRLVLPTMLSAKRGHIVNMSSTAGKHGPPYGTAYGASKAGMISFTESLRCEYHGSGVSASAICPGFTDGGGIYERMKEALGRGTPFQVGSTSAAAVARAVVRSIKKDLPEVIVNWPPLRPVTVLAEISPSLGEWIIRTASSRFLRRVALSRRSEEETDD